MAGGIRHGLHSLHGLHGRRGVRVALRSVLVAALVGSHIRADCEAVRGRCAMHGTGRIRGALVTGVSVDASGTKPGRRVGLEGRGTIGVLALGILVVIGLSTLDEGIVVGTRVAAIVGVLLDSAGVRVGGGSVTRRGRRAVVGSLALVEATNLTLGTLMVRATRVGVGGHGRGSLEVGGHRLAAATLRSRGREGAALRTAGAKDEGTGSHMGLTVVVLLGVTFANVAEGGSVRDVHAAHAGRDSLHARHGIAVSKVARFHVSNALTFVKGRGIETFLAPISIGLADTSSHWECFGAQGNSHRLRALVSSAGARLALEVGLRLLIGTVAADRGEDLDVGNLAEAAAVNLGLQLGDNLLDGNCSVTSTALAEKPLRDRGSVEHGAVELLVVGLVLIGALLRLLLVLQTLLLTLSDGQGPAVDDSSLAGALVLVAPLLDASDLLLNEVNLKLRVLVGVAVTTALVVLAAEVNPNVSGNHASAELVAAEDVGNSLARLGSGVAVLDVHALDLILIGLSRGRLRRRHGVRLLRRERSSLGDGGERLESRGRDGCEIGGRNRAFVSS